MWTQGIHREFHFNLSVATLKIYYVSEISLTYHWLKNDWKQTIGMYVLGEIESKKKFCQSTHFEIPQCGM